MIFILLGFPLNRNLFFGYRVMIWLVEIKLYKKNLINNAIRNDFCMYLKKYAVKLSLAFLGFFMVFISVPLFVFSQSDTLTQPSSPKIEGRLSAGTTSAFLSHETFSHKRLLPGYSIGFHIRGAQGHRKINVLPVAGIVHSRWTSSNYRTSGAYTYDERFILVNVRTYGGLEFKVRNLSFQTGIYFSIINKKFNRTLVYENNQVIYNQIHLLKYSQMFMDKWVIFGELKYAFHPRWTVGLWMAAPAYNFPYKVMELNVYYKIF